MGKRLKKEKRDPEETSLQFKLLALLLLALLTVAFAYFFQNRKPAAREEAPPSREDILGGETRKTPIEDFNRLSQAVQENVETATETVKTETSEVLGAATQKVADYVVENTAGSVATQIEKLPDDQKDELKKQICK